MFNGLLDNQGQLPATTPLAINIYTIQNFGIVPPGKMDHYYFHGSTDAANLSVSNADPSPVNLTYAGSQKPLPRDTIDAVLDVSGPNVFIGGYSGEFQRYKDLDTKVLILASGLVNAGSPAFGLFRIPASYTQDELLPLEPLTQVRFATVRGNSVITGIRLGPNPVKTVQTLFFDWLPGGTIDCVVRSLSGQTVLSQSGYITDGAFQLDLRKVAPGLYTLQVEVDGSTSCFKIRKD